MLAEQRRVKILELLQEEGSARVSNLSRTFDVSEPTIRQDLEKLEAGSTVDRSMLLEAGLIKKKFSLVKVLGDGDISKSLTIAVDKVSKSARQKIEAAGGKIEVKEG